MCLKKKLQKVFIPENTPINDIQGGVRSFYDLALQSVLGHMRIHVLFKKIEEIEKYFILKKMPFTTL